MSRQDALHAEHFVHTCRMERERNPLSPLPERRRLGVRIDTGGSLGEIYVSPETAEELLEIVGLAA